MPAGELENRRVAGSSFMAFAPFSAVLCHIGLIQHTHISSPASLPGLFLFFEDAKDLPSLRVPTWTRPLTEETPTQALHLNIYFSPESRIHSSD